MCNVCNKSDITNGQRDVILPMWMVKLRWWATEHESLPRRRSGPSYSYHPRCSRSRDVPPRSAASAAVLPSTWTPVGECTADTAGSELPSHITTKPMWQRKRSSMLTHFDLSGTCYVSNWNGDSTPIMCKWDSNILLYKYPNFVCMSMSRIKDINLLLIWHTCLSESYGFGRSNWTCINRRQ